ncbi:hypothetical protein HDV03_003217 [Kappamyces sp. JEL0829]|nr:hypothetical protein HDV03_003217 [Kappamyces sp. JEL0829]
MIALVETQKIRLGLSGANLIICPISLLTQWREEIAKLAGVGASTYIFHDRKRDIAALEKATYVLTTYDIILDEAHIIRNSATQKCENACAIDAKYRWALTGTPINNGALDIYSLCKFLHLPGYMDRPIFESHFRAILQNRNGDVTKLKSFLSTLVIRRGRDEVYRKCLPPRTEKKIYLEADKDERTTYSLIKRWARSAGASGAVSMSVLTRTIQCCMHLDLLPPFGDGFPIKVPPFQPDVDTAAADTTSSTADVDALVSGLGAMKIAAPQDVDERIRTAKRKIRLSTKSEMLVRILLQNLGRGEKTVVFSSSTALLGIVESTLQHFGIPYISYTGEDRSKERRSSKLHAFKTEARLGVLLASIKACAEGLNIQEASQVVIYDMNWNPQTEEQAIGRVHRLGQDRPVSVYRLVIKNSIDEIILKIQEEKRKLAVSTMNRDEDEPNPSEKTRLFQYILDNKI